MCRPDGLFRCVADQSKFAFMTFCKGDLCNANDQDCDAPVCESGETRCLNNAFQRCNDSLRSWDVVEQCSAGEVCELSGCQPTPCEAGAYRCNDVYLEVCGDSGWTRVDRCATHALCNAGQASCGSPECAIGQFNCLNTSLQRCNDDRTGWKDVRNCVDDGLRCDESTGTCL